MAENVKNPTKKEYFNTLTAIVADAEANGVELSGTVTYEGLNEFIAHELELLDNKAAAAAKRAAAKRTEGDALREAIYGVLTDEATAIADIVAKLGNPDVSTQQATARLSQLEKLGMAAKDSVKVALSDGKTKTVSAYKLA